MCAANVKNTRLNIALLCDAAQDENDTWSRRLLMKRERSLVSEERHRASWWILIKTSDQPRGVESRLESSALK